MNCPVKIIFYHTPYVYFHSAGDSGYPLEPYLLTPFGNPNNQAEARYNTSHSNTRVVVEQTFGTLKSRFRCLHKSGGALQYEPLKCAKIAVSCMLLHNYCIQHRVPLITDDIDLDDVPNPANELANAARHGQKEAVRREIVQNVFTR